MTATAISISLYLYISISLDAMVIISNRGLAPILSSGALESQCRSSSIVSYNIKCTIS